MLSKIETILYSYNHKTKLDITGQNPAHIFTTNQRKIINEINRYRAKYQVDTRYRKQIK